MELLRKLVALVNRPRKTYSLIDTFGCTEKPPQECPTFLERGVHLSLVNALASQNIIVLYGESRQGKTWAIDRYCNNQLRIGCTADMTLDTIKSRMLDAVGVTPQEVEHTISDSVASGFSASTKVGNEMLSMAGLDVNASIQLQETLKTSYNTVNLSNLSEIIRIIKEKAPGVYFVFDNFHYLSPRVQQQFCSLLKEFNYNNIRIIIVGVWKGSARITSMAPDLINRCEHIDIGSWEEDELRDVAAKGEKALNIIIDEDVKDRFIKCCAKNIGIFKSFMMKYCQCYGIVGTQERKRSLSNVDMLDKALKDVINEAFEPLTDRIRNLALPQREKKNSKHMRLKIVIALLTLIRENGLNEAQNGFSTQEVINEVKKICESRKEPEIGESNIIQELGLLHEREENRQTDQNYIPLFFYDKSNRRVLIVEPSLYQIREYDPAMITAMIEDLYTQEKKGVSYSVKQLQLPIV